MEVPYESPAQLEERLSSTLTNRELAGLVSFSHVCATCRGEDQLHEAVRRFGEMIGYEFILYAYMASHYRPTGQVVFRNISNPVAWMEEYARCRYVDHDPVRRELESRLAARQTEGVILWDAYERPLSEIEEEIIARRSHYGLRMGFSAFCDSPRHDAVFLVSFASSREGRPDERAMLLAELIAPHLNRCRKRLDLTGLVARLTQREQAIAAWLAEGKTNSEIAKILSVSEATVKFHVGHILTKLGANSRQSTVAILIAERCLGG